MTIPVLLLAVLAAAWLLTGAFRRYALHQDLLDHPNDRSSHVAPTPRGGGIAMVVAYCGGLVALHAVGVLPTSSLAAALGAGGLIAMIGFADDHQHVAPLLRLAVHFAAALWALYWVGGEQATWFAAIIVLGLVWATNLFNFMDGIDGIAALETATVAAGGALLSWAALPGAPWAAPLLLAAACTGFLAWNFPPAKIFMGDVGSGFLGISIGVLALASGLYWAWLILISAFVVDATFTLFRRVARRERVHHAHRSHAYQNAAARFGHRPVTLAVGAINVVWLWPLALLVANGSLHPAAGIAIAFAPLVGLVAYFRAGK